MSAPRIVPAAVALFVLTLLFPHSACATRATVSDAELIAQNWLSVVTHETGDWAGSLRPRITGSDVLTSAEDTPLAYTFAVSPDGFVVVPILKELPPVKLYSEEGSFDTEDPRGLVQLVRERLGNQVDGFVNAYGSVDAVPPADDEGRFPERHRRTWDRLLVPQDVLQQRLLGGNEPPLRGVGPLLTTSWNQYSPYYDLCPMGDGGRCVAGCVAISTAQVMNYHAWPSNGFGRHTYWWPGDGAVPGDSLSAVFWDDYDWSGSSAGIAEICYEVGVAYEMNYGSGGSYASFSVGARILPAYFRYDDSATQESGWRYSSEDWFVLIQNEIDESRPMPYSYPGHAIVCDGWRIWGSQDQIHLNYGWGGSVNGWYAVDNIACSGGDHTTEKLIKNVFPDPCIILTPDGTGDYPSIQAAIQAAADGQTIKLRDGMYTGDGNRDVGFQGKAVTVCSQSRDPQTCIIDTQGNPLVEHRGFLFVSGEGADSRLENLWIRGGWAEDGGGAVACYVSSPTIEGCVIEGNTALYGAGIGCYYSSPTVTNCTIYGNKGGGVAIAGAGPSMENTIITANTDTFAVVCTEGGVPQFSCSDIWGNPEGDWTGCIEEQLGVNGNLSVDPIFCAPWDTVLTLSTPSHCLPDNNSCGVVMGALGEGCNDYLVYPDGSGYFPNIQTAVDAAVDCGHIVLVDGVFSGPGNWDVVVHGKSVWIRSFSENAESCIIDCQDEARAPHRAFTFSACPWPISWIENVTLRNGYQPDGDGGAVRVADSARIYIRNCLFHSNEAARGGAAAADSSAQLDISDCELSRNTAVEGGAIWGSDSEIAFMRSTLAENVAETGSGISISGGSLGMMQGIIAFGGPGQAVTGAGVTPEFYCSDVYGNQGGDWVGCLEDQNGENGNRSADPLFCDAAAGNYTLAENSPCLDMSDCPFSVGEYIGCYGVGCTESGAPDDEPLPARMLLAQNHPNPFNPTTTISYVVPSDGHVRLVVYDLTGRVVATLVDDVRPAGTHVVRWDATNDREQTVATGVYFARLESGGAKEVRKLVIVT
jgi:hypothetical protein